jgi:hypothetical protein
MRFASANSPCGDVDQVALLSEFSDPHLVYHASDVQAGVIQLCYISLDCFCISFRFRGIWEQNVSATDSIAFELSALCILKHDLVIASWVKDKIDWTFSNHCKRPIWERKHIADCDNTTSMHFVI